MSADAAAYTKHVQVMLGDVPCRTTTFVADSELLCIGVEAGSGVHDVQVRISDPFFSDKVMASRGSEGNSSTTVMSPQVLTNVGMLGRGVLRPVFFVGGINFLSVGYRNPVAPVPGKASPTPSGPSNTSRAMAQTCELLLRSSCRNTSRFASRVSWLDDLLSASECGKSPSESNTTLPGGLLRDVYTLLFPYRHADVVSDLWTDVAAAFLEATKALDANNSNRSVHTPSQTKGITNRRILEALNCSARSAPLHKSETPALATQDMEIKLDGPVRAVATVMGRVFIGGGFRTASRSKTSQPLLVNHIFEFNNVACSSVEGESGAISLSRTADTAGIAGDGRIQRTPSRSGYKTEFLQSMGSGTDGPVHSMDIYQGLVVVGGTFGHVYSPFPDSRLHSGGLAAWHPNRSEWSLIGRTPHPDASVLQVKTYRNQLYIAGRFREVGGVVVNNVAVHDGDAAAEGGWRSLASGLHGGHVTSLQFVGNEVVVGGDFVRAGDGTLVKNIARWDGNEWQRMADQTCLQQCKLAAGKDQFVCQERNCELDGMVTALASSGSAVYAAGRFTMAGGHPASGIAQYYGGLWHPLPPVQGQIFSLLFVHREWAGEKSGSTFSDSIRKQPCLLAAGQFPERQTKVMRICIPDMGAPLPGLNYSAPSNGSSSDWRTNASQASLTNRNTNVSNQTRSTGDSREGLDFDFDRFLRADQRPLPFHVPFNNWEIVPANDPAGLQGKNEALILQQFTETELEP